MLKFPIHSQWFDILIIRYPLSLQSVNYQMCTYVLSACDKKYNLQSLYEKSSYLKALLHLMN